MCVSHHLVRERNAAWSTVVGKVDKDIVIWTTEREQGRVGGRRERGERGEGKERVCEGDGWGSCLRYLATIEEILLNPCLTSIP